MIYLDNCATTYPKPMCVRRAVSEAMVRYGANSGRSGFDMSMASAGKIYECREKLAKMFGAADAQNVIFTSNCTHSLNLAIKGVAEKGDHFIISNLEHNAVLRPVNTLAQRGVISYSVAQYDFSQEKTVFNFVSLFRPETKAVICQHASNVFGVTFPIRRIGEECRKRGIIFIVDAAQSAGILPIDVQKDNIDILCMPGHKGLYGPMGTGVMIINTDFKMTSLIEGGTGSNSALALQPEIYPDFFESGTLNNSGIIGLSAGVDFVNSMGMNNIRKHEYMLCSQLYDGLKRRRDKVELYLPKPEYPNILPVISFNVRSLHSEETAALLSSHSIAVRAGYHCAYTAHKAFSTEYKGTVRVCPSVFTSLHDVQCFNFVMNMLLK